MSIIDELLVLLDDSVEFTFEDISRNILDKSKQTISSALGRLVARGMIKVHKSTKENTYKITDFGLTELNKNLEKIHEVENNDWDGTWILVFFNIPEKSRSLRDSFRKLLVENGFVRAQGDLWLSFWDKRNLLKQTIKDSKLEKFVTYIKIDKLSEEDEKKLANSLIWNEKDLSDNYKDFINNVKKFLSTKKDSFRARCLVYKYSKILSNDPKFPDRLKPTNYMLKTAYDEYKKIRPYCYD